MRYTFTGAFAPHICGLIEKKQALGYDYHGSACILQTFDKFCREQFPNETCLTAELAMKWAEKSKTEQNLSRLNRVSVIRELAKHMNSVGEQAYLLPLQLTKKTGRHIPYIYSKEDLSKLFKEIDSLQPSLRAPTKHLVVSVIFRMIYCCGLRPIEARRLRRKDVNLFNGTVNILESKGHKDRIVVLSEDNPNSVQQMKQWLSDNGLAVDSLGKKEVAELLKTAPTEMQKVLSLRQQLAKSSVRKYQAMEKAVCADGRARGMFQFYGANRTGRWAGRIIQMQNLPQNHLPDLAEARSLVRSGDFDALKILYEDVPDTLSQLIRTAFVPKSGCKFIVVDFSAIEARVLAWFAGETWRQDVFEKGGDIYCASASQMFKVPVEKHGVNGHLRQKGKIAELALGYGGSVGALKAMGALEMGLSEDELQPLVTAWRNSNQNIVKFWWDIDCAAMSAVKQHLDSEVCGIEFAYRSGMLFITLPSGRRLSYVKPKLGTNQFGGECITYEGIGGTKKWERLETYGPKLVENIVQATSRDILCYAMQTLSHCFITMHIHDELVIEAAPEVDLNAVCEQMGRTPPWAAGLKLRADGYETMFYKKD